MRMAQNCNREYWQQLINKCGERTGELQHKQQELLIRTEALQKLIGSNCNTDKLSLSTHPLPPAPTTHDDEISSVYTKINLSSLAGNQCQCPSEREQPTGLFQCILRAIFPDKNPKKLTAEPQVEKAQKSAPPPPPTTISECLCAPPVAKLSDSSDCICSTESNSSSNNKSKGSTNSTETNNDNNNSKYDQLSLKSEDLLLIQKLEGLLVEQKTLNKQINELEQKERVYKELLKENPINENNQQLMNCRCLDNNKINDNSDNNKQQLCELKLENILLRNELNDLKFEIRQYLERIEGPMQFEIESERCKCIQLEEQIEQQRKEFYEQQQICKNEINTLNIQLMNTNTNLYELNKANEELLSMKEQLELKVKQLEDDLIRQKLSDCETIKCLTEALEESKKSTEQKESCNLNAIARELSRTLKEIGPCGECSRLPSDIKVTAEYIKELAMLIDSKLPPPPNATLQEEDVAEAPPPSESVAEAPPPPSDELSPSINEAEESDNLQEVVPTTSEDEAPEEIVVVETTGAEQSDNSSDHNNNRNDDDIVVVMAENDINSQSSKSSNQVETVDRNYLPTPPTQSPINVQEQSTSKKKCQCSRKAPPTTTTTDESPTISDVEKSTSRKKCQCARREPTTTDQSPTINEAEKSTSRKKCQCSQREPTTTDQSPTINEVGKSASRKKCQCSQREPTTTTTTTDQSPTINEVQQSASRKKCQCSQREPTTTTDQPPTINDESTHQEEIVDDNQATTTTPPAIIIDEPTEEQHEPPTTSRKPCKCAVMKQTMNELNNANTDEREVPSGASEVEEIVPPSTQTISSSSSSDKNENSVENIPSNIDRQVEILDEPPNNNVHVITVITRSGMLDVLTKGPEGHVQTTLRYNPSGNIEVITEILPNENTYPRTSPQIQSLDSNVEFNNAADERLEQEIQEIEEAIADIQQDEEGDGDENE